MPDGYFTPEEANSILPKLADKLNTLTHLRSRLQKQQQAVSEALEGRLVDFTREKRKENKLVTEIYSVVEEIEAFGCVIKDVDKCLIDFPAKRFDKEVWLCWRMGEPRVMYWHPKEEGFNGRQPLLDDISELA
jgi:hypothetical protein